MRNNNSGGYFPQNQGGYYPQNQGGSFPQQNRYGGQASASKKRSGAKVVQGNTKDGVMYYGVTAWFYRRRTGLVTISAFENSRSKRYTGEKNGNNFISLLFEVFYRDTGSKFLEIAQFNINTGKVLLPKTGIVISTKANNGGYAGFWSRQNNNGRR
ncbi:MAG: hypothetical protein Q4G08_02935 [Capnocytophaga sp.]|nr:hypothetical protein [Capnocytophaga sp.]